MWDEFRGHDAKPNAEEREWLETRPLRPLARIVLFAAASAAFGLAVSAGLDEPSRPPILATAKAVPAR